MNVRINKYFLLSLLFGKEADAKFHTRKSDTVVSLSDKTLMRPLQGNDSFGTPELNTDVFTLSDLVADPTDVGIEDLTLLAAKKSSKKTNAPVAPTTAAPIAPQTEAPVAPPPTEAPTKKSSLKKTSAPVAPTNAPVAPVTNASAAPATNAPVVLPTGAPVVTPTNTPVDRPTIAPIDRPTIAPVVRPTNAPVATPTVAPVAPPTDAPIVPCTTCTDVGTPSMVNKGQACAERFNLVSGSKCIGLESWVKNNYCEFTCFVRGIGYDGDSCCIPEVVCTDVPTPSFDSCPDQTSDKLNKKCNQSDSW
eukprot:CAMPEP_0194167514 /NCGR_PEP_ID=MMETSP0154-20130528/2766_1 /TAXON_ID=1049557 /ORGANISM="Thalassiothrix antarctica, Strain L6-D1" /LENGTH=305 /DNA_ID=CAMNT_0038878429 /DNA_START=115 /DNA_END=1029 /DNA_ORIENTATION=+